jgi:N-ethylmaleimide reductase
MTTFNDSPRDSDPQALYGHLIEQLAPLGLACAHVIQGETCDGADRVAFGRPFISNPDFVRRLREDAPLNPLREDKLYGGGAEGYVDYPTLARAG